MLDVRNHSPTGFEWGYGGSGPAQLALAILCDVYGPLAPPALCPMCDSKMDGDKCREWKDCGFDWDKSEDKWDVVLMKPGNYQEFKFDVIAKLPVENWEITEEQISDWLATKLTEPK